MVTSQATTSEIPADQPSALHITLLQLYQMSTSEDSIASTSNSVVEPKAPAFKKKKRPTASIRSINSESSTTNTEGGSGVITDGQGDGTDDQTR